MIKKIAFYLPQFHSIPENDKWWGKGFTEWVNVRSSKPQFKRHNQPEQPLNENYYNLLDINTQIWQAKLANEYGIDGFCYYHYWFEGKLLLEKPMEQMLNVPEINIPFCVCWANETWSRTWDGKENEILIKQNYTEAEDQWVEHFNYLLKFFKDKRYIQDQNRPMLLIYKPQLITNCKDMITLWRRLAKENGYHDLYIGYQHFSAFDYDMKSLGMDFGVEFEPFYTIHEIKKQTLSFKQRIIYAIKYPHNIWHYVQRHILKYPIIYDYDEIWKRIIQRDNKDNIFPGAFPAWDNTPRRGENANVFYKATAEKFKYYFSAQIRKSEYVRKAKYIFINAWNEWAEGAHLEPDQINGYGYLEGIRESLNIGE